MDEEQVAESMRAFLAGAGEYDTQPAEDYDFGEEAGPTPYATPKGSRFSLPQNPPGFRKAILESAPLGLPGSWGMYAVPLVIPPFSGSNGGALWQLAEGQPHHLRDHREVNRWIRADVPGWGGLGNNTWNHELRSVVMQPLTDEEMEEWSTWLNDPEYASWHERLRADPDDYTGRLTFADWLQDRGMDPVAKKFRHAADAIRSYPHLRNPMQREMDLAMGPPSSGVVEHPFIPDDDQYEFPANFQRVDYGPHAGFFESMHRDPSDRTAAQSFADWLRDQGLEGHADLILHNLSEWGDNGINIHMGDNPPPEGSSKIRVNPHGYDSWTRTMPRKYTTQLHMGTGLAGPSGGHIFSGDDTDPAAALRSVEQMIREGAEFADQDPWGYFVLREHNGLPPRHSVWTPPAPPEQYSQTHYGPHEEFFKKINEQPDEATHRAVFADWLEDNEQQTPDYLLNFLRTHRGPAWAGFSPRGVHLTPQGHPRVTAGPMLNWEDVWRMNDSRTPGGEYSFVMNPGLTGGEHFGFGPTFVHPTDPEGVQEFTRLGEVRSGPGGYYLPMAVGEDAVDVPHGQIFRFNPATLGLTFHNNVAPGTHGDLWPARTEEWADHLASGGTKPFDEERMPDVHDEKRYPWFGGQHPRLFAGDASPTHYGADLSQIRDMIEQFRNDPSRWGDPAGDWNLRMILADALQDVGRDREAELLRTQGRHVVHKPDGTLAPGRWVDPRRVFDVASDLAMRLHMGGFDAYPLDDELVLNPADADLDFTGGDMDAPVSVSDVRFGYGDGFEPLFPYVVPRKDFGNYLADHVTRFTMPEVVFPQEILSQIDTLRNHPFEEEDLEDPNEYQGVHYAHFPTFVPHPSLAPPPRRRHPFLLLPPLNPLFNLGGDYSFYSGEAGDGGGRGTGGGVGESWNSLNGPERDYWRKRTPYDQEEEPDFDRGYGNTEQEFDELPDSDTLDYDPAEWDQWRQSVMTPPPAPDSDHPAVKDIVGRMFPGAQEMPYGGGWTAPIGGDRRVTVQGDPETNTMTVNFFNEEEGLGATQSAKELRGGTMDMIRTLKAMAGEALQRGMNFAYNTPSDKRRAFFYAQQLHRMGFYPIGFIRGAQAWAPASGVHPEEADEAYDNLLAEIETLQVPDRYQGAGASVMYGNDDPGVWLPRFRGLHPAAWRSYFDQGQAPVDLTPRFMLADMLGEAGRDQEAGILQDPRRHAYLDFGGRVEDGTQVLSQIENMEGPGAWLIDNFTGTYISDLLNELDMRTPPGSERPHLQDIDWQTLAAIVADAHHFRAAHEDDPRALNMSAGHIFNRDRLDMFHSPGAMWRDVLSTDLTSGLRLADMSREMGEYPLNDVNGGQPPLLRGPYEVPDLAALGGQTPSVGPDDVDHNKPFRRNYARTDYGISPGPDIARALAALHDDYTGHGAFADWLDENYPALAPLTARVRSWLADPAAGGMGFGPLPFLGTGAFMGHAGPFRVSAAHPFADETRRDHDRNAIQIALHPRLEQQDGLMAFLNPGLQNADPRFEPPHHDWAAHGSSRPVGYLTTLPLAEGQEFLHALLHPGVPVEINNPDPLDELPPAAGEVIGPDQYARDCDPTDAVCQSMMDFLMETQQPVQYGFAEDRAAFEQKIIENPFEATHHMVMGDFLDDNDLPDEAAFRRAMGGWFGQHDWRDYPSDGITRGYHQDKHAANVVMDRTDPYQWDLRGLFLSDKDLARNNPEWPVYFPEGVELPDYWIDAENDPDRHGIVMDTTGSAPGGGFYPMGANIQAIGELLSPHIARHHSSTYPMNSRWRWRDLNAFTEAMRRAFMHGRRAKYEGDDTPTSYQTDYGPREEEIGFHRSLLDAVGNNQPWIPIGLGFSDWLRDSDRIAEAEIIRRASEASGLRTTAWGGPSGDQRIGFHGGRGGEGAGSPPWWFEMTHLHPQGTRDPGEEEIYPNAAFDWRFPIEDDYEGAKFAKALMKIGGQPFLGAHWQPDFMGRLGHWTRPEDRVMYPDDITGEFS